MKMKKIASALLLCSLVACANVNDRLFLNSSYVLQETALKQGVNLFKYKNKTNPKQRIMIETQRLNKVEEYPQYLADWVEKEKGYRQGDCVLQHKNYQEQEYYICDLQDLHGTDERILYLFGHQDKLAFVKVFAVYSSVDNEKQILDALKKFKVIGAN